jgi:murein L,D-transpeptidase YcbB/YkuD
LTLRRRALLGVLAGAPAMRATAAEPSAARWLDASGRPNADARDAVGLLAHAARHGLDPGDYDATALQAALDGSALPPRFEAALDDALLRWLNDLHAGRVVPTDLKHHYRSAPAPQRFDARAVLDDALARHDVASAARIAAPALPLYEHLREALSRYRALGAPAAWQRALPALPVPSRKVEPGQAWPGAAAMAERLAALGDLPAAAPHVDYERLDGALIDALRSFQQRHGLEADGVVGRATVAALDVPPARRVRQLELALERLRWTPLLRAPRMIVVNIPEFVLRAYEVLSDGRVQVRLESRVIVGKALDTRTPLLEEDLRHIEFQPYWNVPPSIARKELVPRLRREPGYWAREGFEFVAGAGTADPLLGEAKLQAVLDGRQRIRQRPGPRNALGDIKFVFPNRDSIYLHHTPSVGLFARARRDFSHGCIRVEQPVALAAFALQGVPGWDEARVQRAMSDEEPPSTVRLAQPIPVLIAYGTALVKQGRVFFYEDLYGHDGALDAALRRPREGASAAQLLTR